MRRRKVREEGKKGKGEGVERKIDGLEGSRKRGGREKSKRDVKSD